MAWVFCTIARTSGNFPRTRVCDKRAAKKLDHETDDCTVSKGETMRLGLMVGYSGSQISLPMEMIKEADRLGYYAVWTAEAYGSDAVCAPGVDRRPDRAHQAGHGDLADAGAHARQHRHDRDDARPAFGWTYAAGAGVVRPAGG
jgi:hypothetical protein